MPPQIKRYKALLIFSLLLSYSAILSGQTKYHYVPTTDFNFYQPGNWYCDFPAVTSCVPPWLSGTHSFTVPSTDTIVIHGFCSLIDVTTLTNNGVVEIEDGTLDMIEVSFFHHNGSFVIDNNSMVNNGEGGTYNLNNGSTTTLDGSMSISNFGNLNLNTGANLTIGTTGTLSYY